MHDHTSTPQTAALATRLRDRSAVIGVVGLGYVGLPLALALGKAGFMVLGFDIDARRVAGLNRGDSLISHIPSEPLAAAIAAGRFEATDDFARLGGARRHPDLRADAADAAARAGPVAIVVRTAEAIAPRLRPGQLVVLESTTYPGTTDEVLQADPRERSGLRRGQRLLPRLLARARGPRQCRLRHPQHSRRSSAATAPMPRAGRDALRRGRRCDGRRSPRPAVAEAVKLTENIFRAVNIALVNELKVIYDAMGIDVWEVIDAAKTKPFGFMPFYPGPGLGGHCIPIDPFYLTWKAREFDVTTRFIELAGEINTAMPRYVVDRLAEALDRALGKGLNGSRDPDPRRRLQEERRRHAREPVACASSSCSRSAAPTSPIHDPHVPCIPMTREHAALAGRRSVPLDAASARRLRRRAHRDRSRRRRLSGARRQAAGSSSTRATPAPGPARIRPRWSRPEREGADAVRQRRR